MRVDELSLRARYARHLIRENIARELGAFHESHGSVLPGACFSNPLLGTDLDHPLEEGTLDQSHPLDVKFCIIGAGAAGLYTAMILKELDIPFDLLEASDRVGGRMYTHRFSEALNDYYDVGAMRWPNLPTMDKYASVFDSEYKSNMTNRAFSLFEELCIPLMPYYINGKNTPMMFNNVLGPPVNPSEYDPYKFSVKNGGMVPDEYEADMFLLLCLLIF
jgi:hypothetical protein